MQNGSLTLDCKIDFLSFSSLILSLATALNKRSYEKRKMRASFVISLKENTVKVPSHPPPTQCCFKRFAPGWCQNKIDAGERVKNCLCKKSQSHVSLETSH